MLLTIGTYLPLTKDYMLSILSKKEFRDAFGVVHGVLSDMTTTIDSHGVEERNRIDKIIVEGLKELNG